MNRARGIAFWTAPPVLGLILYWPGLMSWFQKDDFAWLGLRYLVHNGRDLLWALFAPLAEGTIRTISERAFYLSFTSLFGLNPLPFHAFVFLTYAVTSVMLCLVCIKLTGLRAAGFWAAIVWTINSVLAVPLSWSAIYYEILCSLFLLLSLWLLIRYDETGRPVFYWMQFATFVLGFGVLELNVVYPALALAYALCRAPRLVKTTFPLFVVSAAYTLLHLYVAPLSSSGVYRIHWDLNVFSTLWTYWLWALGPRRLMLIGLYPAVWRTLASALLMGGLFFFLCMKVCRREWIAIFFPAWFVIVLSPLLPLRDHMSDYYLTIPLIGFAMWAGWALVAGWNSGPLGRTAAATLLGVYVGVSFPVGRATTVSFYNRSHAICTMLKSIVAQSRRQPEKTVLLQGVDPDMFSSGLSHRPLRLYGLTDVYVVDDRPGDLFMTPVAAAEAVQDHRAVLFDLSSGEAKEVLK